MGQIASLKQSVSELRHDIIGAPTTDDKRREHSLEDENLNLKIRMRQLEEVVAGLQQVGNVAGGQLRGERYAGS